MFYDCKGQDPKAGKIARASTSNGSEEDINMYTKENKNRYTNKRRNCFSADDSNSNGYYCSTGENNSCLKSSNGNNPFSGYNSFNNSNNISPFSSSNSDSTFNSNGYNNTPINNQFNNNGSNKMYNNSYNRVGYYQFDNSSEKKKSKKGNSQSTRSSSKSISVTPFTTQISSNQLPMNTDYFPADTNGDYLINVAQQQQDQDVEMIDVEQEIVDVEMTM